MKRIRDFFVRWYNEGILTSPPPCLKIKLCRSYLSDNNCCGCPCSCVKVGKWGLTWGEKYRSQIMFVAFWLSFCTVIFYTVGVVSLSYNAGAVKNTSWTIGKEHNSNDNRGTEFEIFVGLRMFVTVCSGSHCNNDQHSQHWESADCAADYCNYCQDSCDSTTTTAFMGLITMIPQLSTNLQRSTVAGDFNCQKWMGIVTGIMGCISTLIALLTYAQGCYVNLPSEINSIEYDWSLGPAFYCVLIGTLLKPLDVVANLLVPVPLEGYWDPDREKETADSAGMMSPSKKTEPLLQLEAVYINNFGCH